MNNTSARGLKPEVVARRLGREVDLVVPFLTPFADAARALRPLDRGQTDQSARSWRGPGNAGGQLPAA